MPIVLYPALYAGIRYCTYSLLGILGLNDTELIFTFFYSAPCCPENFNFASRITFDNHEFTCSWLQPKFLINIVMTVTISRFHHQIYVCYHVPRMSQGSFVQEGAKSRCAPEQQKPLLPSESPIQSSSAQTPECHGNDRHVF